MGDVELAVKLVLGQSASSFRLPFYARFLSQSAPKFSNNNSIPPCSPPQNPRLSSCRWSPHQWGPPPYLSQR